MHIQWRMRTTFILISFILCISFSNFSIQSRTNPIYNDTTIVVNNGFIKVVTPYRDGLKNGLEYRIYNGADTIEFIEYKSGKLDGKSVVYYKGMRLKAVSYYKNEYKIGKWLCYDTLGNVITQTTFDSLYHYEDPRWSGKEITFESNKPVFTQIWTSGRRSGVVIHDTSLYAAYKLTADPMGKKLFYEECSSCHAIKLDIVGPALALSFNLRKQDWLMKFIRNGDALYHAGDTIAKSLYIKYGQMKHPDLTYLTSSDVEAIIQYVREEIAKKVK